MLAILLLTFVAFQAPSGVITGQVRGLTGKPATKVRVAAMALPDGDGAGGGVLASLAETDAEGRYRLESVPPGRFYIQAGLLDAPSYYPGVGVVDRATAVQVTAGGVLENIDFTMASSAGVRVRGRVPLSANPRPVRVLISGATTAGLPRNVNVAPGADGSFEFTQVLPGKYTLSVSPASSLPALPIVVSNDDIDLGLPTGPGFRVTGTVGLGPNSPRQPGMRVVLTPPNGWEQIEAAVDPSGGFEFPAVTRGDYVVRIIPGTGNVLSKVSVTDRAITGLVIPALVELTGSVFLEGGGTWTSPPTAVMIEAKRTTGESLATVIRPDGTFRLPIIEGTYRIAVERLPASLIVRSVSYAPGATDLLLSPLVLDGSTAPGQIRLTFAPNP